MRIKRAITHYQYGLVALDLMVCTIAFFIAFWVRHFNQFPSVSPAYLHALPVVMIIWFMSYKYFGLYNGKAGTAPQRQLYLPISDNYTYPFR